ncbi:phage holin family protein [Virgibacillus flavescens]|uniref:phage holin family protein n=1 Tax=Virgibacillus flavescens TaxID=1611422 RepID=UPI003D32A46C
MLKWFVSIFLNAVTLIVVAQLFQSFYLDGFGIALIASIILAVLNIIVKPILILLTLPITFVTFGLFLFVINAITLMITQGLMGEAFVINGFGFAIIASILISILNLILNQLIKDTIK